MKKTVASLMVFAFILSAASVSAANGEQKKGGQSVKSQVRTTNQVQAQVKSAVQNKGAEKKLMAQTKTMTKTSAKVQSKVQAKRGGKTEIAE